MGRWLTWLGVLLCLVLALPFALDRLLADQSLPGISVRGAALTAMQRDAVQQALERRYAAFLAAPVTIVLDGRRWSLTADQLGITVDLAGTADMVARYGRSGTIVDRMLQIAQLYQRGGVDFAPRVTLDAVRAQAALDGIAATYDRVPRDAALSLAAGRAIAVPAESGRQALVDETLALLAEAIRTLEPQTIEMRTRRIDPTTNDLAIAPAVAAASAMLTEPFVVSHAGRQFTWERERVAESIALRAEDGALSAVPDPERLARAVTKLAQLVDSPSSEPRVAFRDGALQIVAPGTEGQRIDQPAAVAAIDAALRAGEHTIELPMATVIPRITEQGLSALGITELIGVGRSSFAGSAAYRLTNIQAGAARMDGVLIAPDEEFSFNTQLGPVDESHGFVQGYAVIGDRTQLEWGGGVCQVSTTVFRSAFWAGVPITERHAHPFHIGWYDAFSFPEGDGPGMDATIFTGVLDLRFRNDTGHWILMETEVDQDASILTVRLYGTMPAGRTVRASAPSIENVVEPPTAPIYVDDPELPSGTVNQTDRARKGMDVTVYRTITEQGVDRIPETYLTHFRPWPDVFVRGTG
jgi:vancomycin resistance protein YoaR